MMQADIKDIHAPLPHKAGYIDAMMDAVRDWKHDCSARRIAAEKLNTMQRYVHTLHVCRHLLYILWRLPGFHKNNIELMRIMTEGIQPAMADSFAVKLEVNLTASDTFHL
jgi:hypothetical protein